MAMTTVFFEDVPVTLGGAQFWASGEVDISYAPNVVAWLDRCIARQGQ